MNHPSCQDMSLLSFKANLPGINLHSAGNRSPQAAHSFISQHMLQLVSRQQTKPA
jgi:hypothetical protein